MWIFSVLFFNAFKKDIRNYYIIQNTTAAEPVPAGFESLTRFLVVNGAEQLLDFIKHAFQGETASMMKGPDGKVVHVTAWIGNSIFDRLSG